MTVNPIYAYVRGQAVEEGFQVDVSAASCHSAAVSKPTPLHLTLALNVPTLLVTMSMTDDRYAGLLPEIKGGFLSHRLQISATTRRCAGNLPCQNTKSDLPAFTVLLETRFRQ